MIDYIDISSESSQTTPQDALLKSAKLGKKGLFVVVVVVEVVVVVCVCVCIMFWGMCEGVCVCMCVCTIDWSLLIMCVIGKTTDWCLDVTEQDMLYLVLWLWSTFVHVTPWFSMSANRCHAACYCCATHSCTDWWKGNCGKTSLNGGHWEWRNCIVGSIIVVCQSQDERTKAVTSPWDNDTDNVKKNMQYFLLHSKCCLSRSDTLYKLLWAWLPSLVYIHYMILDFHWLSTAWDKNRASLKQSWIYSLYDTWFSLAVNSLR